MNGLSREIVGIRWKFKYDFIKNLDGLRFASCSILEVVCYIWIHGTQLPFWSKFHGESSDLHCKCLQTNDRSTNV
jgi:hypothetical protein